MCRTLTGDFIRLSRPWMFIRQLMSTPVTASAPGGDNVVHLVIDHGRRNFRIFHCKRAAETAAPVRVPHLDEFGAGNLCNEPAGLRADAEGAQSLAGVVQGDPTVETGAVILHPHDVQRETASIRKFCRPPLRRVSARRESLRKRSG